MGMGVLGYTTQTSACSIEKTSRKHFVLPKKDRWRGLRVDQIARIQELSPTGLRLYDTTTSKCLGKRR